MNQPNIKINILLSSLYQVLTLIIPFITAPYISRVLGSNGVGIYSYTGSIQTYFAMFAALGTVTYGAREIARNRTDKKQYSKLFWEIEILTIVTTAVCLVFWGVWILLNKEYQLYYLILTLNLLAVLFDISWFYTGLEQFKYTVFQNSIFKILGTISLFVFINDANDTALYIGIMALTTLLSNMTMWIYLPRFLVKTSLKHLEIKKHFKETLVYFVPTIATSIYTVLDKTMIGLITGNIDENGYYEQATKIINMLKAVTFTALNSVLGARISFLFAKKRYDEIQERIDMSLEYILFMGFAICFGLLGVADRFVPLFFGQGYDRVIGLLYMFSPMVIIIGVSNCLGTQFYTPAGYRKESAKYIIFGAVLNFVLNLFLIPLFWGYGAVISSLAAELSISILYVRHSRGYVSFEKIFRKSLTKLVSGIVMFVIVVLIGKIITTGIVLTIAIQVLIGALTYCGMLLLLKDNSISLIVEKFLRKG